MTGLANRALFLQHTKTATEQCRAAGAAFAVHILDLDRFKEVNDTLGHACGDQLLGLVAQRLLGVVGENDIVARLGGDEFAILQPLNGATGNAAASLAWKLLQVFADPFDLNEHRITVETSIGIALAPDNGDEAEQLLKTADLALYKAKSEGRNTYRLFKSEMEVEARRATRCRSTCAMRFPPTNLNCTINPSLTPERRNRAASRLCCAGGTRNAAWSRRTNSSRSRKKPA